MKNEILGQIESLAESLVLWDGKAPAQIAEKLDAIASLAEALGQPAAAEAARGASRSLLAAPEGELAALAPRLGEIVSALQDVFANGRNPAEIAVLKPA